MSNPNLTPSQQMEIQKYQQMTQKLNQMQQNYLQMDSRKHDMERTLETIKDFEDDGEVYRSAGQILYKSTIGSTKKDLTEQLELLEVRVTRAKKQLEEYEETVKNTETKLRASLQ